MIQSLDTLMITKAGPEHIGYLCSLKEHIMRTVYRPTQDDAEFERWRIHYCTTEYFEKALANSNNYILFIGSLREPAGMMMLRREDKTMEIDDLLVGSRGQGIGRRLLRSALQYANCWNMEDVWVDLYPNYPRSAKFLLNHGFEHLEDSVNELGTPMHRYHWQELKKEIIKT